MDEILALLQPLIVAYGGDLGIITQIVTVVGSLRLVNKPLFAALKAIVEFTYWTEKDNILLAKIESSKVYKGFVFVLDWLTSIKLPKDK